MKKQAIFLSIITVIIALLIAAYLVHAHLALAYIAGRYDIDVSYRKISQDGLNRYTISGLEALDRRKGAGIYCSEAIIVPSFKGPGITAPSIAFNLKGVKFIRNGQSGGKTMDDIMDLVELPFENRWTYSEIVGEIQPIPDGIYIKSLSAKNDALKLSLKGKLYSNNNIEAEMTIYFSRNLINELPGDVTRAALKDEGGGWMSISANVTGNYKAPSIRVSGNMFRLTIREVGIKE